MVDGPNIVHCPPHSSVICFPLVHMNPHITVTACHSRNVEWKEQEEQRQDDLDLFALVPNEAVGGLVCWRPVPAQSCLKT